MQWIINPYLACPNRWSCDIITGSTLVSKLSLTNGSRYALADSTYNTWMKYPIIIRNQTLKLLLKSKKKVKHATNLHWMKNKTWNRHWENLKDKLTTKEEKEMTFWSRLSWEEWRNSTRNNSKDCIKQRLNKRNMLYLKEIYTIISTSSPKIKHRIN